MYFVVALVVRIERAGKDAHMLKPRFNEHVWKEDWRLLVKLNLLFVMLNCQVWWSMQRLLWLLVGKSNHQLQTRSTEQLLFLYSSQRFIQQQPITFHMVESPQSQVTLNPPLFLVIGAEWTIHAHTYSFPHVNCMQYAVISSNRIEHQLLGVEEALTGLHLGSL